MFNDPHYFGDLENSVRCGRGSMDWAKETALIDVNAGDTLEVAHHRSSPYEWRPDFFENCPGDRLTCETRWVEEGYLLVRLVPLSNGIQDSDMWNRTLTTQAL